MTAKVHPILQRDVRRYSALDAFRLQQTLPFVQPAPAPRGPGRPRLIGQSGLSMMLEQIEQESAFHESHDLDGLFFQAGVVAPPESPDLGK